jgi:hypothetical protein
MKKILATIVALGTFLFSFSIPKYGEGGMQLKGVQLLQDSEDANAYYYIPRFPRMSTHADGSFEFMFIKYVGKGSAGVNGGLFHALIEFTLPGDEVDKLQDTLRIVLNNRNARIIGPVPLQQAMADGDKGVASFQVVSSILNNSTGANAFTTNIITSGFAPFLPGSKAAIAARLSQEGATLLWESLKGKTSDVSVSVSGYYEAYVKAYRATITAEMNSVYEHYSRLTSVQEGFNKDQMRRITDDMLQNQVLKIEAFDRTASLGIKADEMKALLSLVTDKLIELMFDTKAGWAKAPERETAIEPDQIKGRQDRGWFSQTFGGAQDVPYYTDNQFVLKRREDIRTNKFYLDLTQSTSIKVPVHTSGNLAGVYDAMQKQGEDVVGKYFKVVNLDDRSFQKRDVAFMIDGGYAESFNDIFNFVSVSFRKKYPDVGTSDVTSDLMFTRKNIESNTGGVQQVISYPRLDVVSSDWLEYEYKVSWNLKNSEHVIKEPKDESQWIKATGPGITLLPPISKRKVTLEVDRSAFADSGRTSTVVIKFLVVLGGRPTVQRTVVLRSKDATNIQDVVLFHDPGEAVAYQVTQFTPQGEKKGPLKELTTDFIMIGASEIIR